MTGSAKSSAREPPEHYVYELFLDDKGQKISKSKGNGLTIDEWLTYADPDSLSLYMYNQAARGQEALLRRHSRAPSTNTRSSSPPIRARKPRTA